AIPRQPLPASPQSQERALLQLLRPWLSRRQSGQNATNHRRGRVNRRGPASCPPPTTQPAPATPRVPSQAQPLLRPRASNPSGRVEGTANPNDSVNPNHSVSQIRALPRSVGVNSGGLRVCARAGVGYARAMKTACVVL